MEELLKHGIELNPTDIFGNTILHYAAFSTNLALINYLCTKHREMIDKK